MQPLKFGCAMFRIQPRTHTRTRLFRIMKYFYCSADEDDSNEVKVLETYDNLKVKRRETQSR